MEGTSHAVMNVFSPSEELPLPAFVALDKTSAAIAMGS